MIAFFEGKLLNENLIRISPFSTGFQYGKGFFTTLKYQNRKVVYLPDHLSRLRNSLNYYKMLFPKYDFQKIINTLVDTNKLSEARIKIILFEENNETRTFMFCRNLNIINESISLKCVLQKRGYNEIYHHKTLNYLENTFTRENFTGNEFDDNLYISCDNKILETSIHNIFFLKNDILYTPSRELPILPGIIREKIIKNQNIRVVETDLFLENLSDFSVGFVTNSIQGIIPIKRIDRSEYNVSVAQNIKQNLSDQGIVL